MAVREEVRLADFSSACKRSQYHALIGLVQATGLAGGFDCVLVVPYGKPPYKTSFFASEYYYMSMPIPALTSSKSFLISSEGSFVRRDTTMIRMLEKMNAGSSS